ncbi:MAG: hypothetical protein IJZ33_08270 [Clostridia bacterium]|nr:hypothetical protein [Clostridia bacterium]
MKKAAKIFTIISIVLCIFNIVTPIIGFITLSKMKKATCKKDLTLWAILNIIFCNPIGGILMLCLKDSDFAPAE